MTDHTDRTDSEERADQERAHVEGILLGMLTEAELPTEGPWVERSVSDVAADLVARGITEPTAEEVEEAADRLYEDAWPLAVSFYMRHECYGDISAAARFSKTSGASGADDAGLHLVE